MIAAVTSFLRKAPYAAVLWRSGSILSLRRAPASMIALIFSASFLKSGCKSKPELKRLVPKILFAALPLLCLGATGEQPEARYFFAEYEKHVRSGGKRIDAADKLSSALALQPMNPLYRYAELELYQSTCFSNDWDTWINHIRKQFERCKKFHADFPDYRNSDWNRKLVFNEHKVFGTGGNPFREIHSRNRTAPTAAQIQQLTEICDDLRSLTRMDMERVFYPYDLSDGINSMEELWNYKESVWRSNWSVYYADHAQFLKERASAYAEFLDHAGQFLETRPQPTAKIEEYMSLIQHLLCELEHSDGSIKTDDRVVIDYLNSLKLQEIVAKAQTLPLATAKHFVLYAQMVRAIVNAPRTREAVIPLIDGYYRSLYEAMPECLRNSDNIKYSNWLSGYFTTWWIGGDCRVTEKRYQLFRKQLALFSLDDEIRELSQAREIDWPALLLHTGAMRQRNIERIGQLKITNSYQKLSGYFASKNLPESSPAWRFFQAMNADFEIRPQSYEDLFAYSVPLKLRATLKKDDRIYLILSADHQTFMLGIWDLKTAGHDLYPLPENLADDVFRFGIQEGNMAVRPCAAWDVGGGRVALATTEGNVLIFSLETKTWRKLEDVVPASARGLAIVGDRIYVLSSRKGHVGYENYLSAFDFNGGNYKIIFSSSRSAPKHQVERLNALPNSLLALVGEKLLFIMSWDGTTLFSYDIRADRFEEICRLPQSAFSERIYLQGQIPYVQAYGYGDRVYRIDLSTKTAECVLIQNTSKHKLNLQDNFVRTNTNWGIQGPFVFTDQLIWSAWYNPVVVDRKQPQASPPFFLPPCPFLTPGKDENSVIYFSFHYYFSVTVKKQGNDPVQ